MFDDNKHMNNVAHLNIIFCSLITVSNCVDHIYRHYHTFIRDYKIRVRQSYQTTKDRILHPSIVYIVRYLPIRSFN
jgi:hypothetical protein